MTRLNPKIIPSNAEYCSYCKSKKYSNITTHSSSVKKKTKNPGILTITKKHTLDIQ